jgi:hypothetical protein
MRNRRACHRRTKCYERPHELVSFSSLSFNHKEWGKTTTKTDAVALVAERVPVANRTTGVPAIAIPSAPSASTSSFEFHFYFLAFLLITKSGEKQQRKPRL